MTVARRVSEAASEQAIGKRLTKGIVVVAELTHLAFGRMPLSSQRARESDAMAQERPILDRRQFEKADGLSERDTVAQLKFAHRNELGNRSVSSRR